MYVYQNTEQRVIKTPTRDIHVIMPIRNLTCNHGDALNKVIFIRTAHDVILLWFIFEHIKFTVLLFNL